MKNEIQIPPPAGRGTQATPEDDLSFNTRLSNRSVQLTQKAVDQVKSLADQMKDAQEALELGTNSFHASWLDWHQKVLPQSLEDMRLTRMTVNSELSQLMKPLSELRKFFLGPEHDEEIRRLKEFVELCERLQALKQSGFLDSVADTMLKLS